jgi:phosphoserine phosphatase
VKIAIFLDVDITLTADFIQAEYARQLGCFAEYKQIEAEFQLHKDAIVFGRDLIKIFSGKNFQENQAGDTFNKILLQPWADHLLKLPVDIYLVSSGPSYYINRLAQKFDIDPKNRVCCSEYIFDPITNIINGCHAVDSQQKATFVNRRTDLYDLTIGIGDDPEHDEFVTHSTFPILTSSNAKYLHAANLPVAIRFIESILEINKKIVSTKHDLSVIEAERMTITQVMQILKNLSIQSWMMIFGLFALIFSLGAFGSKFIGHLS